MAVLKHCCFGCSLRAGTIAIAVICLICSLGARTTLVQKWYTEQYIYHAKNNTWQIWDYTLEPEVVFGSGATFIQTILGIFLLFGATLEIAGLLLPWIIVKTLDLLGLLAIELITSFFLIAEKASAGLIIIADAITGSLFATYCLMVVYSYYQTLLEKERPNVVKEITVV